MNKILPIIYSTMGRTAAGKTTLAQWLHCETSALYVPEGALKRTLRIGYQTEDSLDESLRDYGYTAAIAISKQSVAKGQNCVIDASFHRRFRRQWLYNAIASTEVVIIWLYCKCNSRPEIEKRIRLRKGLPSMAATQANSMEIFDFIDRNFEELASDEVSSPLNVVAIEIDTFHNTIANVQLINAMSDRTEDIENTCQMLDRYLLYQRANAIDADADRR
jgi:predicted kinase